MPYFTLTESRRSRTCFTAVQAHHLPYREAAIKDEFYSKCSLHTQPPWQTIGAQRDAAEPESHHTTGKKLIQAPASQHSPGGGGPLGPFWEACSTGCCLSMLWLQLREASNSYLENDCEGHLKLLEGGP